MKDLLEIYKPHARRWLEAEYSSEYSEQHVESLAYLLVSCRADGLNKCEALARELGDLLEINNHRFEAREALANYRGERGKQGGHEMWQLIDLYIQAFEKAIEASIQSHNGHWDKEGTGGKNCPECIRSKQLRDEAREFFDRAQSLKAKMQG